MMGIPLLVNSTAVLPPWRSIPPNYPQPTEMPASLTAVAANAPRVYTLRLIRSLTTQPEPLFVHVTAS